MILSPEAMQSIHALTQFSMAEMVYGGGEKRGRLPEPARIYAAALAGPTTGQLTTLYGLRAQIFYEDFVEKRVALAHRNQEMAGVELLHEQLNIDYFLRWGIQYENKRSGQCYSARIVSMLVAHWLAHRARDWRTLIELTHTAILAAQRTEDTYAEALLRWRTADVRLFCRQEEAARKQPNRADIRGHEEAAVPTANQNTKLSRLESSIKSEAKRSTSAAFRSFAAIPAAQASAMANAFISLNSFASEIASAMVDRQDAISPKFHSHPAR
jgi:hypothetical protein